MNTRRTRSRTLLAALAITSLATLAACGDDDAPAADTAAPAATTDETTDGTTADTTGDTTADTTDATTTDAPADTTADTTDEPTSQTTDDTTADTADTADTTPDTIEDTTDSTDGTIVDSEFCRTAAEAESLGDEVDVALNGSPAELEVAVTAAIEAARESQAIAPPEVADTMAATIEVQERFAALLAEHDWDANAAFRSPEGQAIIAETQAAEAQLDEVRTYLEAECGIRDDSDDPEGADLPEGDAGLRRFIQLYAIGARVEVTQEQEDCFVEELSGEVDIEVLEGMLTGATDEDVQTQIGMAVLACDIPLASAAG